MSDNCWSLWKKGCYYAADELLQYTAIALPKWSNYMLTPDMKQYAIKDLTSNVRLNWTERLSLAITYNVPQWIYLCMSEIVLHTDMAVTRSEAVKALLSVRALGNLAVTKEKYLECIIALTTTPLPEFDYQGASCSAHEHQKNCFPAWKQWWQQRIITPMHGRDDWPTFADCHKECQTADLLEQIKAGCDIRF
jgi:hypothetical protein